MLAPGIRCPVCGGETEVRETRQHRDAIRRRRHCRGPGCDGRITTIEVPAPTLGVRSAAAEDLVLVPRRLIDALRDLVDAVSPPSSAAATPPLPDRDPTDCDGDA